MMDKPQCCHMTCEQPAEYEIWPHSARRPDEHTEACTEHVGALLGYVGTSPVQSGGWVVLSLSEVKVEGGSQVMDATEATENWPLVSAAIRSSPR